MEFIKDKTAILLANLEIFRNKHAIIAGKVADDIARVSVYPDNSLCFHLQQMTLDQFRTFLDELYDVASEVNTGFVHDLGKNENSFFRGRKSKYEQLKNESDQH